MMVACRIQMIDGDMVEDKGGSKAGFGRIGVRKRSERLLCCAEEELGGWRGGKGFYVTVANVCSSRSLH